ncbi:HD domain-containing protein [Pseudochryseolinea flava]|uniref:Metal-dependent phosphohydrolase n=1 Tax=Pseudochryseolinea flava TaxID=2059302 RepID=A0A364Y3A8_9BACT|nr:HD domain-containing protein [Pseudochryseolinea flava]RAW01393.1 metal-dependent phosphohydrolase [Pseudochryseolinea flava]
MNDILEKVKVFADHAHGDQRRKYSNERYIFHPMRVMENCRDYTDDVAVLAAALLHDVLEDTTITKEEMHVFLHQVMPASMADRTLALVVELTDVYTKKNYPELNRRARKMREADRLSKISGDAQTVKYADIIDNVTNIFVNDPDFAVVFIHEGRSALRKMTAGDEELFDKAVKMIEDCLDLMHEHEPLNKLRQ